jgi:hypothetical protein
VTTPDALMLPRAVLLLLHVPPGAASLNVMVEFTHTEVVPVIAASEAFTVTIAIALQPEGTV